MRSLPETPAGPGFPGTGTSRRDEDLKPRSLAFDAGLLYGEPRYGKDLPGEKQAKTGILSKPAIKNLFLVASGDACAVIGENKRQVAIPAPIQDRDHGNPFPVPECILDKVEEDFFDKLIGIDLEIAGPVVKGDTPHIGCLHYHR